MGKVSINVLRSNLYLSASFPRRDGQPGKSQARLALKLGDTPANRKVAEKRRAVVQRQLDQGTFSWDDWQEPSKGVTWRNAIDALYRKRVVMGRTSENTWTVNYWGRLRQAPITKEITTKSIVEFMSRWPRDTCSYKEAFYLIKDLCQLVNVNFPELPVPTYTTGQIKEVPSDKEIVQSIQQLKGAIKWHLGMMATYGLRPLETLRCQFVDDKNRLQIDENTKTGFRIVVPLHPEWVELFDLRNIDQRDGRGLNQWMFNQRKKAGINWKPYALRHAYAGRLWIVGGSRLSIYNAARLMGHSAQEHERTYRQWIAPQTIAEAAERALQG